MVKSTVIIGLTLMTMMASAQQNKKPIIRKGLTRAQMTFAPGVMLKQKTQNLYLHADLEFYLEKRVSIRSDSYAHLLTMNGDKFLKHYYSTFFGAAYHYPMKNFDFLVSLQPGMGFANSKKEHFNGEEIIESKWQVFPMVGVGTGVNYYIHRFFHFMVNVKYVKGKYTGGQEPVKLDEFFFSAGLGWNVNILR